MQNKQAACFLILLLTGLCAYGVMFFKGKNDQQVQLADKAFQKLTSTQLSLKNAKVSLNELKKNTEAVRQNFREWEPELKLVDKTEKAEEAIQDTIRESKLYALESKSTVQPVIGNKYVTKVLVSEITLEDDFHRIINWMGNLEETRSACRVTSCSIVKGASANDVRMKITIELPIMDGTPASDKKI
jgi:hypothetical protein